MPPHATEGFEQKEKSRCGTASHALSLWKHISHLKGTDCQKLHLSGKLTEQAQVFLSASRVLQEKSYSLFPPLAFFPVQTAKVGYTQ